MTVFVDALREAASRRILAVGVIVSVLFIGLFWLAYAMGFSSLSGDLDNPQDRVIGATIMTVLGLYAVQFLAAFLAILLSTGAVAAEIDSGRALAVLARPVSRRSWLAQRAAAFAGLAVVYVVVMTASVLAIANGIGGFAAIDPARAIGLLVLEVVLLAVLGVALSTRLSAIAAGVVVVVGYGLAWLAGIIEFVAATLGNEGLERVGIGISLVLPSDALWRGASFYLQSPVVMLAGGVELPFASLEPPSPWLIAWSLAYLLVLALLAVRTLDRRDL